MKRKTVFVLFVLLFVILSSCDAGTPANININANMRQADFFPAGGGQETLIFFTDVRERVANQLDLTKHTSTDAQIYMDAYPVGDGGAEFAVTQAVTDKAAGHFRKFAHALQLDVDAPQPDADLPWLLMTKLEDNDVVAGPAHLGVHIKNPGINPQSSIEDVKSLLAQDKYLTAALQLLDVEEPYIEKHISHDNQGGVEVSFVVTENSDDISQLAANRELRYLELVSFDDYSVLSIRVRLVDFVTADTPAAAVSYDDALARALKENPDHTKKDILACELVYNSNLVQGYWIPCYRFYLDKGKADLDPVSEASAGKTVFNNAELYYVAACDVSGL